MNGNGEIKVLEWLVGYGWVAVLIVGLVTDDLLGWWPAALWVAAFLWLLGGYWMAERRGPP